MASRLRRNPFIFYINGHHLHHNWLQRKIQLAARNKILMLPFYPYICHGFGFGGGFAE